MILLDTLLLGGLRFVLARIADAVAAERGGVEALREELLAARMRLELGEITEEEYARQERALVARLRELREREGEASGPRGGHRVTGVEARAWDEE